MWPSGKAPGFGPGIRGFESLHPSQLRSPHHCGLFSWTERMRSDSNPRGRFVSPSYAWPSLHPSGLSFMNVRRCSSLDAWLRGLSQSNAQLHARQFRRFVFSTSLSR